MGQSASHILLVQDICGVFYMDVSPNLAQNDNISIKNTEEKPIRSQKSELQYDNTTYIITTTFNEKARETVEQKLLRLVTDRISGRLISDGMNVPENGQMEGIST